jgi:hypothetical protein
VLIIVLGVLAVLALLATTFATLQATERQIAVNYLDTVRAKLLAQSAIQDAEARLREYFPYRYFNSVNPHEPKPWKFWGRDVSETKEPNPDDKIEECLNPSFAMEARPGNKAEIPQDPSDANIQPLVVMVEGKARGLSGIMGSSTYAVNGDQYVLKVSDISGRLYINDGLDGDTPARKGSVSQNLQRILNVLGDVIKVKGLGDRLIANRPQAGYRSPQDLLKALDYDEHLYNRIRDYVTVYAWVDPNVVNPVPLSQQMAARFTQRTGVKYDRGTAGSYRFGSQVTGVNCGKQPVNPVGGLDAFNGSQDPFAENITLYGLDTLNPQWIEVVSRAPVNVNAAPREVLIALLTGIQGFFITDRRRNNPRWKGDLYLSFKQQSNFDSDGPNISYGDEYGWIVETFPIVNEATTGQNGIAAAVIADEIIACRNRQSGRHGNYSGSGAPWFSGPFKTWHQFNAFIDYLAKPRSEGGGEVFHDPRGGIYFDYDMTGDVDPTGFSNLQASELQQKVGAQAIADAVKANFNPNLHLNELNPDLNLFQHVDKTDLFVNSTEFSFVPTGYFEIEALGRILRPRDEKITDVLLGDNVIVAQAKVTAIYKLYDMYRESTHKQFYGGTLSEQGGAWGTNNGYSLEIGPEPDNGQFPGTAGTEGDPETEYAGYIALPTNGGPFGGRHGSAPKPKNALMKTQQLPDSPHLQDQMHVHFALDHDAHHHVVDRAEIASGASDMPGEHVSNHPDWAGAGLFAYGGPYNPTKGRPGFHRVAKSYRLNTQQQGGTKVMRSLEPYPPSDLRIDGAYVERHSAPAYYNTRGGSGVWAFDTQAQAKGTVTFWWKPSFAPEATGKIRTAWDLSRYHNPCGQQVNVWPFALWFFPSQYDPGTSESAGPKYWHNNMGQFEPASLTWGTKAWHDVSPGYNFGRMTMCLNHLGHDDHKYLKPNPFRHHQWMHTAFVWSLQGTDNAGTQSAKLYVNGSDAYSKYSYVTMTTWGAGWSKMSKHDKHEGGEENHIRLGGTSRIADAAILAGGSLTQGSYRGNFSGDHTIDEVYMWANDTYDPNLQWMQGRYYVPSGRGGGATGGGGEGRFTSDLLDRMVPYTPRQLPPPSTIAPPGGIASGGSALAEPSTIRILGVAWTYYGERLDESQQEFSQWIRMSEVDGNKKYVYDYGNNKTTAGTPSGQRRAIVRVGIQDGTLIYGPFESDGFSAVLDKNGRTPRIQDPKLAKYFVDFEIEGGGNPVLLATPVLDDVTIFWDDEQTHLLSYIYDNRTN